MIDEVEVGFDGGRLHKAFFDPEGGTLDLVVEGDHDGGSAVAWGDALCFDLDAVNNIVHLAAEVAEIEAAPKLPERPDDCGRAMAAGVTLQPDQPVRGQFDASAGVLRLVFGEAEPKRWARLSENLIWIAIDDDANLAALVIEGISRDPGGKAQLTWLAEMNAGE